MPHRHIKLFFKQWITSLSLKDITVLVNSTFQKPVWLKSSHATDNIVSVPFQNYIYTLYFFVFYFIFLILFLNFTILYWFCHILKWIRHRHTCVPHPEPSSLLPPHTIPLGRPSAPAPSIQYHASNLDWRLGIPTAFNQSCSFPILFL